MRPKLWAGRGADLLGPVAYVDTDGTIAGTYGEHKAGMDMSYKGIWGYAPLIVSLANTKEVLYLVNLPGNAASQRGQPSGSAAPSIWSPRMPSGLPARGHRLLLDRALRRLGRAVDFVFGMDANAALRGRAEALDESCWSRLDRPAKHEPKTDQRRRRTEPQAAHRHRTRLPRHQAQP